MSHFYRQRSYSFNETDEMLKEIKDEMSNFLTKEEAELILNRRHAMIDPIPYQEPKSYLMVLEELHDVRRIVFELNVKMDAILKKLDG
jgi:uncharacterized protein YbaP (TraB family)